MTNALTATLKKKKKGFTLIELIIVIAIIAILAALAIPRFSNIKKDANLKADLSNAKTIESAVATLRTQDKFTDTELTSLATATGVSISSVTNLSNYLQTIPTAKAISGGTFKVHLDDSTGAITVYVDSTQILPAGTGVYATP
jgi:type IV pilus assembly protein PilA